MNTVETTTATAVVNPITSAQVSVVPTTAASVAPSTVVSESSVAALTPTLENAAPTAPRTPPNARAADVSGVSAQTPPTPATSTRPPSNSPQANSPVLSRVIAVENTVLLPGQIGFANESRFNAAFFSEPLTEYATGWKDPHDLESILDFVAPPVQVGRRFEYKQANNAEAFLLDADDFRAIGADFKRVEYRGSSVNDKTLNKGLTVRIDLDAVGDTPDWRELFTARLLQRLVRNELKRAVDLMVNNASNAAKTWDTSAGKDPDQDVLLELITANDAAGIRPNRVLYGDVAWNKRMVAHRAQATAGGFSSASLSLDQLSSYLLVDGVQISRERYQSTVSAKSKITPDVVLLFFGMDRASTDDPTSVKRFWSPVDGGGKFRVYEQQVSAKMVDLTVEFYSNVILTSSLGLRKLTIS